MNKPYRKIVKACRVCLETNCKLYEIHKNNFLVDAFNEFTSSVVAEMPGVPPYLCTYCCSMLKKAAAFRNQCIEMQNYLHEWSLIGHLTIDIIERKRKASVDKKLSCTEIISLSNLECDDSILESIKDYDVQTEKGSDDIDEKYNAIDNESKEFVNLFNDNFAVEVMKAEEIAAKNTELLIGIEPLKPIHPSKIIASVVIDDDMDVEMVEDHLDEKLFDDEEVILTKEIIKDVIEETKPIVIEKVAVKNGNRKKRNKKGTVEKKRYTFMEISRDFNFDVITLSKEEQIAELKARKMRNSKKEFNCEICFLGFNKEEAFRSHMRAHDPKTGPELCDVCHSWFPTREQLRNHTKNHKWKYKCKSCPASFKCIVAARHHYFNHEGKTYTCDDCGKMFSCYQVYSCHIREYHGSERCDICYKRMRDIRSVIFHKEKMHKEVYVCHLCDVTFHTKAALGCHQATPDCSAVRPCRSCGENFKDDQLLDTHITTTHFVQKELYQHIIDHGAPTPRLRAAHSKHLKDILCEICGDKKFHCPAALRYHQRKHTGEKPYQCSVCLKRFKDAPVLTSHMTTHREERPYECELCPKAFKTYCNRRRHLNLVHMKLRRYGCDLCGKTFQSSSCVKAHVNTVHLKIPQPPRIRNKKKKALGLM